MARSLPDRSYQKKLKMFKIKKIKPLFDTVITTAKRYEHSITSDSGLILSTSRMEGSMNDFQTVVAVGEQCRGVQPGDVVHINFMSYARAEHKSAGIGADNIEKDKVEISYQIPMVEVDGMQCLYLKYRDLEYVAEVEVDEGGLLQ